MTATLTPIQIGDYQRDGFIFPLDVYSTAEAQDLRSELEDIECNYANPTEVQRCLRLNAHYTFPLVHRIASNAVLLDAVESLLGPNILAWGSELFAKGPHTEDYVSWHQDLTYWGMGSTDHEVTAWLALSDVTVENGCMRFLPGSHKDDALLTPIETFADNNSLFRGQELPVEIDESKTVNVCLKAGQVSLHHGRMYHASSVNGSGHRRIGLTIRYITPEVKLNKLGHDYAMLVRGQNTSSEFVLVDPPTTTLGVEERAIFEKVAAHQEALYVAPEEGQAPKWNRLT